MSQNNEADYPRSTGLDPGRIRLEDGFLLLGTMALTAAVSICAVDEYTAWDPSRGVYSILTGLFVVGGIGYVVRSCMRRLNREMCEEAERLLAAIAELRVQRDAQETSPQWAPPWGRGQLRAVGGTYASQAAMDVTTQPLRHRVGLDAETIADAREIARKMLARDEG